MLIHLFILIFKIKFKIIDLMHVLKYFFTLLTTFVREASLRTSSALVVSNRSSSNKSFSISSSLVLVIDSLASWSKASSKGSASSGRTSLNSAARSARLLVRATASVLTTSNCRRSSESRWVWCLSSPAGAST